MVQKGGVTVCSTRIWSSLSQPSADGEAKETSVAAARISEASHAAAAAGTVYHSQHGGTTPPEPSVPPSVVMPQERTVGNRVTWLSTLVTSTAFKYVTEYRTPVSVTRDVCARVNDSLCRGDDNGPWLIKVRGYLSLGSPQRSINLRHALSCCFFVGFPYFGVRKSQTL